MPFGRVVFTIVVASLAMATSCQSRPTPPITSPEAAVTVARDAWPGIYDKTRYAEFGKDETKKFEP
jgi:hypothetical protein